METNEVKGINQANDVFVMKQKKRRRGVPVIVFILCLIIAFLIGAAACFALTHTGAGSGGKVDQQKIDTLQSMIDTYYKGDPVKKEDMVEGAYHGYVNALNDPYTTYMTKSEFDAFNMSFEESYSGIGVTFTQDENGAFVIVSVTKDSPAAKAGLEAGDFLISVDGKEYTDSDIMASKIRGKKGTKVDIEYMRDTKTDTVTIVRDDISQQSVESEMKDGNIGYIHLTQFIENTGADFDKALKELQSQGAKGLVLDLRDNGGGLVDECVTVADEFLDKGVVTYTTDKNGKMESYDAVDGRTEIPTVILINGNSASASEILAYALKDNGYKTVGEKSFGKGVIQNTVPLADGSALKMTIMEYLSPHKNHVHKKGIEPDVSVEDDEDTDADEQLDKAVEVLEDEMK